MMCGHCRMHVEKALNGIDGVRATVELEPPVATVEFGGGENRWRNCSGRWTEPGNIR